MTDEAVKPVLEEVAAINGDDVGGALVRELRQAADEVLQGRGNGDLTVYEKVWRDGQVKSTFEQRRNAVISREWNVEPGGPSALDKAAADDLREQMAALDWDAVCKKMLFGVFLSYAIGECMYAVDGTRVLITGIKVRKAKRFRFGMDGQPRLLTRNEPRGRALPLQKFWVFTAGAEDDDEPHGLGLAHWLYWPVWFKRNGMRFWSTFLERFASPTPVAKVPAGAKESDRQKLLALLRSITSGGRLVIPNTVELELLKAIGSSGGDYVEFENYLDREISKIVLSQTMTTDDGSSRSQAEVHGDVKLEVIKTDADLLCESWNNGPAKWLTEWNFPGAAVPKVWRDCSAPDDLTQLAERDTKIYELGYEPTAERILATYGEGYVKRAAVTPAVPAEFAEPTAREAVSSATGEDEWRDLMSPEAEALERLASECSSLEEFRDRLGEVAQRNPDALTEGLARMMFAANVGGQVGMEIDGDD